MSEDKKETKKDKNSDPTMPHYVSGYFGKEIVMTEKGWFMWDFPANLTREDNIFYLNGLLQKINEKLKEEKEKEKEEYKKVPVETK